MVTSVIPSPRPLPVRHEPQPLARVRQLYHCGVPAVGDGDPEHRRPAPGRGGRVVDLDGQPGQAAGGVFGHSPRPRRARPPPRLLRVRPVQRHDGAGDVPGMQVGPGHVGHGRRWSRPPVRPGWRPGGGPPPGPGPGRSPCTRRHRLACRGTGRRSCPAERALPPPRTCRRPRTPRWSGRTVPLPDRERAPASRRPGSARQPPGRSRAPPGPPGATGVRLAHPNNRTPRSAMT